MGKEFIEKIASAAQAGFPKYGILASVTIAQAILESGWGSSSLAATDNNLFGIKFPGNHCPDITFSQGTWATDDGGYYTHYNSWADSVEDHGYFLRNNSRYAAALGLKDPSEQIRLIAAAGYASASNYNGMVMEIINDNNLTQYDNGTFVDNGDINNTQASWKQGWNKDTKGWFYVTDVANKQFYSSGDGWKKIKDVWYIFNDSGYARQNEWFQDTDGSWYFFDNDCKMVSSTWILVANTNIWYYVNESGKMVEDKWFSYKNKMYYLKKGGEMAAKEWHQDGDKWYYLNPEGDMAINSWVNHNEEQYYLGADGAMFKSTTVTINGKSCTFNDSGVLTAEK